MERERNTDVEGNPFTAEIVEAVWQKAHALGNYATLRVDAWGWTIVRDDYGNQRSQYGWEIDHVIPVAQGGTDDLTNLQPLHWQNHQRKDELQYLATVKFQAQDHPLTKPRKNLPPPPPNRGKK